MKRYEPIKIDPDEIWGKNLQRMQMKHLHGLLWRYKQKLAHKLEVAGKHKPGTRQRTRAEREIAGIRERMEIVQNEINRRKQ